jgi:ABC-2 type transport system permease protein
MRSMWELAKVEMKLFFREPVTLVFTFGLPLIFYPILGTIFGKISDKHLFGGVGAMAYYTPAYISLVIASIGLVQLPALLAGYKERGVLRRFRASSLPIASLLGAQLAVSLVITSIGAVLLLLIGTMGYGVDLPVDWLLVIFGFSISVICFVAIGFFLGAIIPTARAAQGAGLLLYIIMMLLGGAGPPEEILNHTLVIVGNFTPLKHIVEFIQTPWLGKGWNGTEFVVVAGITVLAAVLSIKLFRWD